MTVEVPSDKVRAYNLDVISDLIKTAKQQKAASCSRDEVSFPLTRVCLCHKLYRTGPFIGTASLISYTAKWCESL
jgi:hypothetical protein